MMQIFTTEKTSGRNIDDTLGRSIIILLESYGFIFNYLRAYPVRASRLRVLQEGNEMLYTPHAYQTKAIRFCLEHPCAGLWMSPGLGKSSVMLSVFNILKAQGFVKGALVIAPLRAIYAVWPEEARKWDEFRKLSVGVLHGTNKSEVLRQKHDVYAINYEGLSWLAAELSKKPTFSFDMLIVDESHKFKDTSTQRFKVVKTLLPKFKRRYILTGSPTGNSLMDLFGQMYVMDLGKTFGPYISRFREQYFFRTGYGGYEWTLKKGAEKEIYDCVAPKVIHMKAEDYLDLPDLIINDVYVDLSKEAMAAYKQMEIRLRLDMTEGRISAANAGVASMKCRQIANGGVYIGESDRKWASIHDSKTDAVKDLVEELQGQPAFIAYDFHHDLERLKDAFGDDTPHIGSGVTPKQVAKHIEQWNKGEIQVLLGHPQSAGLALNLQGGNTVIFHSLPWSGILYEQFICRLWRQGQKQRVIVHRIIARGTIDEAIIEALKVKSDQQENLFAHLKKYLLKK